MTHDPDPFRFHFFASYSTREDEINILLPHLDRFLKQLKQRGFHGGLPFWMDRVEIGKIDGSDAFLRSRLAAAIDRSIALIAFVSPGYITSEFCRFEWRHMERTAPPQAQFSYQLCIVWKPIRGDDYRTSPHAGALASQLNRSPHIELPILESKQGRRAVDPLTWDRTLSKAAHFSPALLSTPNGAVELS